MSRAVRGDAGRADGAEQQRLHHSIDIPRGSVPGAGRGGTIE